MYMDAPRPRRTAGTWLPRREMRADSLCFRPVERVETPSTLPLGPACYRPKAADMADLAPTSRSYRRLTRTRVSTSTGQLFRFRISNM